MSEERAQRFNTLIKRELGKIILGFLDVEPGVLVTVTRVSTNSNLFTSIVYVSVYPPDKAEKIMEKLNRSIYQMQQILNKKMRVRPVPKIIFRYDKNPESAAEIEKILEEIKKDESLR